MEIRFPSHKSKFYRKPKLKYPCNVHGNIRAEKSIHFKIFEWTYMVHRYSRHMDIHWCIFNEWIIRHGYCMDTSIRETQEYLNNIRAYGTTYLINQQKSRARNLRNTPSSFNQTYAH